MAYIVIHIDTDNDAFRENMRREVRRVLSQIHGRADELLADGETWAADSNGNLCACAHVREGKPGHEDKDEILTESLVEEWEPVCYCNDNLASNEPGWERILGSIRIDGVSHYIEGFQTVYNDKESLQEIKCDCQADMIAAWGDSEPNSPVRVKLPNGESRWYLLYMVPSCGELPVAYREGKDA
jgi:hypothetical protein